MVEQPDRYMQQNQEILREIRDELRGANRHSGAPSSGGGYGGLRPSPGVIHAQMTADRVLSGEWASLGWSNAYRPAMQTSITQDILAATGLGRAPNTLTQREYESQAISSLGQRVVGTAGSLVAPEFMNRSGSLAQDLFANSSRFIRYGNANAGIMGTGFSFGGANRLAREVQIGAMTDLRLSGDDYSTIASTGMRSGQFDQVGNASEFKTKLNELAQATGDLTRAMRMSVGEVSQMMGNLRTVGITDVSEQRRIGTQIMAASQVAGMTAQEMLSVASNGGAAAQRQGLNWQTGAGLAMQTVAQVRAASQAGMISPTLMAMGGGAEGIQGSINSAQTQWLTSDGGYMQMLGGIGRGQDAFSSMMGGVAATGGTLSGVLAAQAGKVELLSKMGQQPGVIDKAYSENLKGQLRLMGITDFTSGQARDMVYSMTRGSMGDAGALAYARTNFSAEGLRIKDSTRLNELRAEDTIDAKLQYDNHYMANSFRGRVQHGIREATSWPARMFNGVMNWMDPGQSGFMGVGGQYKDNLTAIQMGAVPDSVRFSDLGLALGNQTAAADPMRVEFNGGASLASGMAIGGQLAGGIGAGMWAGAKGGALGGTFIGGPVGTVIGGAIGGIAGGLIGAWGGEKVGALLGAGLGSIPSPTSISGGEAKDYIQVAKATAKASAGQARGRELVQSGELSKYASFNALAKQADRSAMGVADSQKFAKDVQAVARETGVDVESIVGALKVQGVQMGMTNAYELAGTVDLKALNADMTTLLGGTTVDANMAMSSSAAALKDYLGAVQSGDEAAIGRGRMGMASLGIQGDALDKITRNFQAQDSGGKSRMLGNLGAAVTGGANAAVNRSLSGAARRASGLIDEAESSGLGGMSSARAALAGTAGDRRKLLDLLDSGNAEGASLRAALGSNNRFKEVMDVGQGMDLQSAEASEIARKYHGVVSADEITQAREKGVDLKKAIQARLLEGRGAQEADANGATKEAALLNDAARILQQLGTVLGVKSQTA